MIEYTIKVNDNGSRAWYLNGERHREDGPAYEGADGTRAWYLNGQLHREDGPAYEWTNGDRSWYLNGQFHREDGPAYEGANGDCAWYLNDKRYTEEEFLKRTATPKELTVAEIEALLGYSVKVIKG